MQLDAVYKQLHHLFGYLGQIIAEFMGKDNEEICWEGIVIEIDEY